MYGLEPHQPSIINISTTPDMHQLPRQIPVTTLFGGAPTQTITPSQGYIYLYQDAACNYEFTDNPTPLVVGECLSVPFQGIKAVSFEDLPTCDDGGNPILLVSDTSDCTDSGTRKRSIQRLDVTGRTDQCLAYSTGADIGSVELVCYGKGLPVTSTAAANPYPVSTTMEYAPSTSTYCADSGQQGGDGGGSGSSYSSDSSSDCCTCVIM